ncbi:MAG: hypothetical protein AAF184_03035 [Pseudomonadota bacterium]
MQTKEFASATIRRLPALAAVGGLLLCANAGAQVLTWDEGVDGDLSTDPEMPTPVSFVAGSNTVRGQMQDPDDTRDYITFTIADGQSLTAVLLNDYTDVDSGGPGDRGFVAVNEGDTSFIPGFDTGDLFLGGAHLDPDPAGTDYLAILAGAPQAGTGFTPPLGPGTYSFLVQQTGPELTAYELEFVLAEDAEDIGGSTSDVTTITAICRNLSTGQSVNQPGLAGAPWNCTAAGLLADSGDQVLQIVVGRASCGADPCAIGGMTTGVDASSTLCRNISTGQTTNVAVSGGAWDCTGGGFAASNGNIILQVIRGASQRAPSELH